MAKYKLIKFTSDSLVETKAAWEAFAGADAFDLEFSAAFEWTQAHVNEQPNDSMALCLFNTDAQRTDAIIEVVDSRKGTLTKLLKIIPTPMFWDVNNSRTEIIQLYTEAFFNVITHGGFGKSRTVKLYGRDDEMMSLLRSIHSHWAIADTSIEFQGRFLTITIN